MVPLNPNELRRDTDKAGPITFDSIRGAASTGVWNDDDDMTDDRWAFNLSPSGLCSGKRHTLSTNLRS